MFQQQSRYGEHGTVPFRAGRFYCAQNEWWFAVRRGPDQGPYPTKAAARQALIEYLDDQCSFAKPQPQDC